MMIELTSDEVKLVRKSLQCVSFAHMLVETQEGTSDRDTPIDALIRKFKEAEKHNAETVDLPMIDTKKFNPSEIDPINRGYIQHIMKTM